MIINYLKQIYIRIFNLKNFELKRGFMDKKEARQYLVPGLAILGLITTGLFGIFLPDGASIGKGLGIIGSALAFGIILHISFLK